MQEQLLEVGPITFLDTTGQTKKTVKSVPSQAVINEICKRLLGDLKLKETDGSGRPISYRPHLERESRLIGEFERAEVLRPHDRVRLNPTIDAG